MRLLWVLRVNQHVIPHEDELAGAVVGLGGGGAYSRGCSPTAFNTTGSVGKTCGSLTVVGVIVLANNSRPFQSTKTPAVIVAIVVRSGTASSTPSPRRSRRPHRCCSSPRVWPDSTGTSTRTPVPPSSPCAPVTRQRPKPSEPNTRAPVLLVVPPTSHSWSPR